MAEESQDLVGSVDLLCREPDELLRVGAGPGVTSPDNGVEDDACSLSAASPRLERDLCADPLLSRFRLTVVELGPVCHVELSPSHLDARQGQADSPILVRDERVLG